MDQCDVSHVLVMTLGLQSVTNVVEQSVTAASWRCAALKAITATAPWQSVPDYSSRG